MASVFPAAAFSDYRLAVTDFRGEHHFAAADIIRMEAVSNYTVIYFTRHRPFVASKVLKVYETLLQPYGFLRTHRRHLVNSQHIKSIEATRLIMQDASVAELSKRKKSKIIRQLK